MMIKPLEKFSWLPCGALALVLVACGSGTSTDSPGTDSPGTDSPGTDSPGTDSAEKWPEPLPVPEDIVWGPRLDMSDLSPVLGAEDDFSPDVIDALVRAAKAVPNGASQSSRIDESGKTMDEVKVRVVRDDKGKLVHRITDNSQMVVDVPSSLGPRQDFRLALFTHLIPGIEVDLSSYPHELLGIWAWDDHVGAFWSRINSQPLNQFADFPSGSATYKGDAVGLHAADGATAKFLAEVTLNANFDDFKMGGTVSKFRLSNGSTLDDFTVNLGETDFSTEGEPFSGNTTADTVAAGSGKWGASWSDGKASTMGGTFGFAAEDESVAVLGAFTSECSSCSPPNGNPDDPVANPN